MICPFCRHPRTTVVDKRDLGGFSVSRRRRECGKCQRRFTTYERVEDQSLFIVKKDGRREAFNRAKLEAGILKAVEKRPISQDDLGKIMSQIELALRRGGRKEVPSKKIGDLVMKKLKKLDPVAYVRFASVCKEFRSVKDFREELKELRRAPAGRRN